MGEGAQRRIRLYHGSSEAVAQPSADRGTGFADLGRGFYVTDDHDAARRRALTRARMDGAACGVVSVYEFDLDAIEWHSWGEQDSAAAPFALRFKADEAGIAAWIGYISACRTGETAVPGVGEPAVVRAWIATDIVEMADSGLVEAAELAAFVEPDELIVQYCFRDQDVLDRTLVFIEAQEYPL